MIAHIHLIMPPSSSELSPTSAWHFLQSYPWIVFSPYAARGKCSVQTSADLSILLQALTFTV